MNQNIMKYESKVWATADLLIGAGIKQSDFPKYMMPFFALIMVESRLLREAKKLSEEYGVESVSELDKDSLEDFINEFSDNGLGYNDFVIRRGKKLKDICANDKSFDVDFHAYLKAFDGETKYLLGVDKGNDEEKFMDISGISGLLKKKKILFSTVKAWSEIDLLPFDNSEITTLEEHIKRKWADISAETAGEQYTPNDVISLISEIILSKISNNGKLLSIYDPTCGGGNMLFGVEDRINAKYNRITKTFGEDWNDNLYALAKIESRFREDSIIEYGNSLTGLKFSDKKFNVIVANPPYGVDWKGYKKDIEMDQTDRFVALPSISDGQFLFTQHILSQLDDEGVSVVVHNGSTLFSGDAGSSESNIRKYFFDQDYVEAIIQLPSDEFFNTGIYTYLWVFNKNKKSDRTDRVIMIDASQHYEPLQKSRGKKRKEMLESQRLTVVDALTKFENNDFAKVYDKWDFYYNKQAIQLTLLDTNEKSFEDELPVKVNKLGEESRAKSLKLKPIKIEQNDLEGNLIEISDFVITDFDKNKYSDLKEFNDKKIKPLLSGLDGEEFELVVETDEAKYSYCKESRTLLEVSGGKTNELGCGKIVVKSSYKKATKTKAAQITISAELLPKYLKDSEYVQFSPDEKENEELIDEFMSRYILLPFKYLDNVVGIEINFNKIFYKKQEIESSQNVTKTIVALQEKYKSFEPDFRKTDTSASDTLIECAIERIDELPSDWRTGRLKDFGYLYSGLSGKKGDDFNNVGHENNKGFIPFTNIAGNLYLDKSDLGTVVILPDEKQNKAKQFDIFFLMSSEGYEDIGKSSLLTDELTDQVYLNSFCKGFRLTTDHLSPKFLNYLLHSHEFREKLILEGKGFTRINLKMDRINDFELMFPPDPKTQEQIEQFLDAKLNLIDNMMENLEDQIEQLERLKESLINDVTTGKVNIK